MRGCVAILSVAILSSVGRGEDALTIQLRALQAGDRMRVEAQTEMQVRTVFNGPDGKPIQETSQQVSATHHYEQTVLDKPAGAKKPTKLKRAYSKARIVIDGRSITLPYEGKTVVIEKAADKYRFLDEAGKELTPMQAGDLDGQFNRKGPEADEQMFLPKSPVKVGDTWKIDPKPLLEGRQFGDHLEVDLTKATLGGTLTKSYRRQGKQYGVLTVEAVLPVKVFRIEKTRTDARDSSIKIQQTVDVCTDGSESGGTFESTMMMVLKGTITRKNSDEKGEVQITRQVKSMEKRQMLTEKTPQ